MENIENAANGGTDMDKSVTRATSKIFVKQKGFSPQTFQPSALQHANYTTTNASCERTLAGSLGLFQHEIVPVLLGQAVYVGHPHVRIDAVEQIRRCSELGDGNGALPFGAAHVGRVIDDSMRCSWGAV